MSANRRIAPRYPSWLPGALEIEPGAASIPVRVVDLSLGGAAIEGDLSIAPGSPMNLFIDWGDLGLSAKCVAVASDGHPLGAIVRVRFDDLDDGEALVVTALVGAMAAEFHDQQVELFGPGRHRQSSVIAFRGRAP